MVDPITISIEAKDNLSPAFRSAMQAGDQLSASIARLLKQEQVNQTMKEAEKILSGLTVEEKKSALAVYEFDAAQKKAAESTTKLNQQNNQTKGNLSALGGQLNNVVQGLTGFSLSGLSAAGAIVAVGNAARKAVSDYTAYALAMDKLSMVMGTDVAETSTLIQVADDFRVEQSSMENAMRMAVQNGFTPTIESIAQLADKYNSIRDPIQRAAEMEAVFGKSWKDLLPLLSQGGQAIREAASSMDAGLVVTRQQAVEAIAAAKATDDWNDSITAYKNSISSAVLPTLTSLINLQQKQKAVMDENKAQWTNWIPIVGTVVNLIASVTAATEKETDSAAKNADAARYEGQAKEYLAQQEKKVADAKSKELTGAYALVGVGAYQRGMNVSLANSYDSVARSMQLEAQKAQQLKGVRAELSNAAQNLEQAEQRLSDTVGNKASASMEKAGASAKKYREALQIQDQVFNTNTAAQYDAQKALDQLSKDFASGKISAAEYATGLESQRGVWASFDSDIAKAKDQLDKALAAWRSFIANVGAANGSHVTITVDVATNYGGGGGGGSGGSGGSGSQTPDAGVDNTPGGTDTNGNDTDSNKARAGGGTMFAGKPYYVGEFGPEPFVPTVPGYTLSRVDAMAAVAESTGNRGGGGGWNLSIGTLNLPGVTNAREFIDEMGRITRNASRSGAGYAGGMR